VLPTCKITSKSGVAVSVTSGGIIRVFHNGKPLGAAAVAVEVDIWRAGFKTRHALAYNRAKQVSATRIDANATLTIAGERWLTVFDSWQANSGGISVTRTIEIHTQQNSETGFAHRFVLPIDACAKRPASQLFIPAIAYGSKQTVPKTALASDPTDTVTLVRADRLPYPTVAIYNPASKVYAALIHDPDGCGSVPDEDHPELQIDARFQTPCVGIETQPAGRMVYAMPGTEGSRTYVHGPSIENNRYVYRAQPLIAGTRSTHKLRIVTGTAAQFSDVAAKVLRIAIENRLTCPASPKLTQIEQQQLDVLSRYLAPVNGVPTLPFSVRIPDGFAIDTSCQFGFIGQAMQAAALLLGRKDKVPATTNSHAVQLLEFFIGNCLSPQGIPRTWFDITGPGVVRWRSYESYLRVIVDGLSGILQADSAARKNGITHAAWRPFVIKVVDKLLGYQASDGGFPRAWNHDGSVFNASTTNTSHIIPLLVDLYAITKQPRFHDAALLAGQHLIANQVATYNFVGGTPDNPDVIDKEAGVKALSALLALYDLTGDKAYVRHAATAAGFVCSWTYYHDVRIPDGSHDQAFPKGRGTRGSGIIATGHSGADTFSSVIWFDLLRLYVLTGDVYWHRQAIFHAYASKQLLDHDGSLGYALPGLQNEAFTVAPLRGRGVRLWLPFLATTHLEPIMRATDVYGISAPEQASSRSSLLLLDQRYSRTRGLNP
jgi:hypothetical protein